MNDSQPSETSHAERSESTESPTSASTVPGVTEHAGHRPAAVGTDSASTEANTSTDTSSASGDTASGESTESEPSIWQQTMEDPLTWWSTGLSLVAMAVWAMWEQWADIYGIATTDEEASHILLVPLVAGWLMYLNEDRFANWKLRGLWVGVLMVCGGWFISSLGLRGGYEAVWHFGAVLAALGAMVAVVGTELLRRFPAAMLVLLFMVPVPGFLRMQISHPLQDVAASATAWLLGALAFPVDQAGNVIEINGQRVAVAEACNGMRMVFALFLATYAAVFGTRLAWWVRGFVLLLTPLIAIIFNLVRMGPTVLVYGYGSQWWADKVHDWGGWAMLFAAFGVILLLLRPFEKAEESKASEAGASPEASKAEGSDNAEPDDATKPQASEAGNTGPALNWRFPSYSTSGWWAMSVAAVALTVMYFFGREVHFEPELVDNYHAEVQQAANQIPRSVGSEEAGFWLNVEDEEATDDEVRLLNPNVLLRRHYRNWADDMRLTMIFVHSRDARNMSYHYPPICFVNQGWEQLSQEHGRWAVHESPRKVAGAICRFEKELGGEKRGIDVWYFLVKPNGKPTSNMAEVANVSMDPRYRRFGAAQIQFVFQADVPQDKQVATVTAFLNEMQPVFEVLGTEKSEEGLRELKQAQSEETRPEPTEAEARAELEPAGSPTS